MSTPMFRQQDGVSLQRILSVLIRRRRVILLAGVLAAMIGFLSGVLSERMYISRATFVPQDGEPGSASGLAAAASQLGFAVSTGGAAWGAPMYLELLQSASLLENVANDSSFVFDGRRVSLADVLQIEGTSRQLRLERTIRALRRIVSARQLEGISAVEVRAATPWPAVSHQIVRSLLQEVNQFNIATRKSQAAAERTFAQAQADSARVALRLAEDQLQEFLERNRAIGGSAELAFQRDRLQRAVAMRQGVYSALLQSVEEAKVREVRNTPVITVIEDPRIPTLGEPRRVVLRTVLGGMAGTVVGILMAITGAWIARVRAQPTDDDRELLELLSAAIPRTLRRRVLGVRGATADAVDSE